MRVIHSSVPACLAALLLLALTGSPTVRAQIPGSLDTTFDPGTGVSGDVHFDPVSAVAAQADGKILIGGG